MTEQLLQSLMMQRALVDLKHQVVLPNDTSFYGWESDLLTINKSGLVNEFECKISRADYLRDKHKYKFKIFEDHKRQVVTHQAEVIKGYNKAWIPNYFWYVTLDFDIEPPQYAGWLKVTYNQKHAWYDVTTIKTAPRLHTEKPQERLVKIASRLLSFKLMNVYINMHVRNKVVEVPKE